MSPSSRALRPPAVAGTFYPAAPARASAEAARLTAAEAGAAGPSPAIAVVSPHAGWMYSGALAGRLFARVAIPERVLVLAPNHTGRGARASLWTDGAWCIPGREIAVDDAFVHALLRHAPLLEPDREAHDHEHAIEVLLPLLVARQPALRIAAVVLGGLSFTECEALAAGIAAVVAHADGPTLIVASSDMNHYLADDETRALDDKALAPLTQARPARLVGRGPRQRHHHVRLHPHHRRRARRPRPRRDPRDIGRPHHQRRRQRRLRPGGGLRRGDDGTVVPRYWARAKGPPSRRRGQGGSL